MKRIVLDPPTLYPAARSLLMNAFIASASLAVLSGSLSTPLVAQNSQGSIVGGVADATGAAVSGATVTVTSLATNEKRTSQTSGNGEFRFLNLLPAAYRVEVQAPSFKRFVIESLAVSVDNAARVDAALQVGAVDETVIVTTQPPVLQTDSGTLGFGVEGKQVEEMPLNGRNPLNLIALAPGVVAEGGAGGSAGTNQQSHTNNSGWGNFQIGGSFSGQSAEYLDGAPLNTLGGNAVALVPTQDVIQEFRVSTNSVSPEFGRFSGGVVEFGSKSGANAYHGTVYEYFRNNIFNANNFFSKLAGVARPKWNQDQYGAAFSGPLKKDKAFFFFSWEGFRSLIGVTNPTNVPTQAMQNGVFTKAIVDPTGKCPIVHDPVAATWTVPQSCWDATAKVMKNLFPLPLTPNSPSNNYYVAPISGTNANQYGGRVDYTITPKQRLFARYTYWPLQDIPASEFKNANGFQSGNAYSKSVTHQAVLGDTYTISPTLVADVRASYLRSAYYQVPPGLGFDESTFGPAFAALAPSMTFKTIPVPTIAGADGLYAFNVTSAISTDKWNTYALSGSVTKVAGVHTFKFGGSGWLMQRNGFGGPTNPSGRFNFTSTHTGDEFAAFLLGQFDSATITTVEPTTTFNYTQGYYALDTWQVNRSLTLNLGVRYELPGGMSESKDRATVLLPNTVDPYTNVRGTLALVNSTLYPSRSLIAIRHNLFSPRVGFAQRLGKDTVLRGGYGLNYLSPDLQSGVLAYNSTINQAVTTTTNVNVPTTFLANPFPGGILSPLGRSNPAFMVSRLGQAVTGPIPNQPYPYVQQWNLTLQEQLAKNFNFQLGYVGSKGSHLPGLGNTGIDELGSQYYSLGSSLLAASTSNPAQTLGQTLRPYPSYQNLSQSDNYSKGSTYHSLQTQGQLRFGSGGVLTANYTWAKFISDTDTQNSAVENFSGGSEGVYQDYNNPQGERSISSFDTRNRVVINYVVELPFGKGRLFGSRVTGVADKFVSGWGVNGISTFQAGFPLALTYSGGNYLTRNFGAGTLRPKYTPGCTRTVSGSRFQRFQSNTWFNAACFSYPGDFAFGNEPRVDPVLHNQGVQNYDFSILKATPVKEGIVTQFRMEFFNIFNHTQFNVPGTAVNGANFNRPTTQANQPRLIQASFRVNF